eukprot:4724495-Lingulodinium_polyedra.AAC.1
MSMGSPWATHELSMDCSWLSGDNPWTMDSPWTLQGQAMYCPCIGHGLSMDNPWAAHGLSMDKPWIAN